MRCRCMLCDRETVVKRSNYRAIHIATRVETEYVPILLLGLMNLFNWGVGDVDLRAPLPWNLSIRCSPVFFVVILGLEVGTFLATDAFKKAMVWMGVYKKSDPLRVSKHINMPMYIAVLCFLGFMNLSAGGFWADWGVRKPTNPIPSHMCV